MDTVICKGKNHNIISKGRNIISEIMSLCPDIVSDKKKMRAYLMDFIPKDKMLRNVIYLSFEVRIPQELVREELVTNIQFQRYKKRLTEEYAVSDSVAEKVVSLWINALGIESEKNHISQNVDGKHVVLEESTSKEDQRARFWGKYAFDNVQKLNYSNMIVMYTGCYCIVESCYPEGPVYIYDKDVYLEKIKCELIENSNSEARNRLMNLKSLAKKIFYESDKQHPERMHSFLVENGITKIINKS